MNGDESKCLAARVAGKGQTATILKSIKIGVGYIWRLSAVESYENEHMSTHHCEHVTCKFFEPTALGIARTARPVKLACFSSLS